MVDRLVKARQEKHPIKRMRHYAFAIAFSKRLNVDSPAEEIAREVLRSQGVDIKELRLSARDFYEEVSTKRNNESEIARTFFDELSKQSELGNLYELAAEFQALRALILLQETKTVPAEMYAQIANYRFKQRAYDLAAQFYSLALQQEDFGDFDSEKRAEVLSRYLLSKTNSQNWKGLNIGLFEDTLQEVFNTDYRDPTLFAFANYLEKQKDFSLAYQGWQWVFRYSFLPFQRAFGAKNLERKIFERLQEILDGSRGSSQNVMLMLQQTSAIRRAGNRLSRQTVRAFKEVGKLLNLVSDPIWLATMAEIEK